MMKNVKVMVLCLMISACASKAPVPNPNQTIVTQTQVASVRYPPFASPFSNLPTLVNGTLGASLDRTLREDHPGFSGTILVVKQGKVLLSKGYGLADQENDVPNTPETKFAIGSITKSFTAMAIMILKERMLLDLQDTICKYISPCPPAWKAVTLKHLLTHTSGIYNYTLDPGFLKINTCQEHKPEEIIPFIKDHPLDFPSGSQFRYDNSGYFLLGMVIEKVTGVDYEAFLQKNILQPSGMIDTGYNRVNAILKDRASGYSLDSWTEQTIHAPCYDGSNSFAAGGLYSTVGDLYKWDQVLYTDQLVSKDSLSEIFTSSVMIVSSEGYNFPPGSGVYGYGWMIGQQSGHRVIKHGGKIPGYASFLARYPDDQVTIIILSNWDRLHPDEICGELADIIFKGG
jgi:CubicO group peptidase (beta-lactamase class C family)